MKIQTVCVYCGSSNHVDESYKRSAEAVGTLLAQNGYNIVYGGGHVGLMGIVAESALKAGGKVTGIIPKYLSDREVQQENLTELRVVDNMHIRKAMMEELADGFLVLPGGFGTLDEIFEILTWKQIGLHNKPVVLFNQDGFWNPMLSLVDHLIAKNFAQEQNKKMFHTTEDILQIIPLLNGPADPISDPKEKWG